MGEAIFTLNNLSTIFIICFWFCSTVLVIKDLGKSILKITSLDAVAVVIIAIIGGPFFMIVKGFEYLLSIFLPDDWNDSKS